MPFMNAGAIPASVTRGGTWPRPWVSAPQCAGELKLEHELPRFLEHEVARRQDLVHEVGDLHDAGGVAVRVHQALSSPRRTLACRGGAIVCMVRPKPLP